MSARKLRPIAGLVLAVFSLAVLACVACTGLACGEGSSVTVTATVLPVLQGTCREGDVLVRTNLDTARLVYGCSGGGGSVPLPAGETRCHGVSSFTLVPR